MATKRDLLAAVTRYLDSPQGSAEARDALDELIELTDEESK